MKRPRSEVWFLAMIICFVISSIATLRSASRGADASELAPALLVALWAPFFGVMGLRSYLLTMMGIERHQPAPDDARWKPRL